MNQTQTLELIEKTRNVIREQLKILDAEYERRRIDSLKDESNERFWYPKNDGDGYIYISPYFATRAERIDHGDLDENCYDTANCYKLSESELAEKDATRMKARQIIQRTADKLHDRRYEYVRGDINYYISYDSNQGKFRVLNYESSVEDLIFFETDHIATKCLELCIKEFEILYNVKDKND